MPGRRQEFLYFGAHYLNVKWPEFLMISAGQDSNIVAI